MSVCRVLLLVAALGWSLASPAWAQTEKHLHTRCAPGEGTHAASCSVLASIWVTRLPDPPLFWHLDAYPTREAAAAHETETSAVVVAHDQVWLLTVAAKAWRPDAVRRVATVGPLPVPSARRYGLWFIAGEYSPGVTLFTHKHSGPEAFYVLEGEQCVEMPGGVLRAGPGDGMVVPADTPMSVRTTGASRRRVLTLIVQDGDQRSTTPVGDWMPSGLCIR
ncbi:MAG TPA: cupin domain-containing protein [Methylomirabilota bacterium]|nr:cupin domain-containing protein [Methylomirabilota bacterium]